MIDNVKKKLIAIDIGNTSVEFAFFDDDKIIKKVFFDSKPINLKLVENFLKNNSPYVLENEIAIISSVVVENNLILKELLENKFNLKVHILNASMHNMLIDSADRDINTIGMDILCKSAWAVANNKKNVMILDMGTASVLQCIKEGVIIGAAITSGINLIYKQLCQGTSLLPQLKPQYSPTVFGNNTQEAIHGGSYWGYVGLVNGLLNKGLEEIGSDAEIFITGGMSNLFKDNIVVNFKHDMDIIFKGIRVIYEANQDKIK